MEIQISDANTPQPPVQRIMNVRQIIHVSEIFVIRTVTAIKTVWQTSDVCEVLADRFVITTLHVEMIKSVKIDCVKLVAETI